MIPEAHWNQVRAETPHSFRSGELTNTTSSQFVLPSSIESVNINQIQSDSSKNLNNSENKSSEMETMKQGCQRNDVKDSCQSTSENMKSFGDKANNTLNGQYPSSQVSPMESEPDNPRLKVNPSKLREFMKRDEIVKKLEHFISNGCGNPRHYSLGKVSNETLSSPDDNLQH